MEKKTYEQPEIEVVEIQSADIICTSSLYTNSQNETYGDGGSTTGWY